MAMHRLLAMILSLNLWLVMSETMEGFLRLHPTLGGGLCNPHLNRAAGCSYEPRVLSNWNGLRKLCIALWADNRDFTLLQRTPEPEDVTIAWMGALA
jgi:hypothetical protein